MKRSSSSLNIVPDTFVSITSQFDYDTELVATFLPANVILKGTRRVAGKQVVDTNLKIDFGEQLPLYWMASVLRAGDLSPNISYQLYSSDNDTFSLPLNSFIRVSHDDKGWHIPEYDSNKFMVNVGVGFLAEYLRWGYSVLCTPQITLALEVGAYELVKSNGQDRIGDPVANSQSWRMPIGYSYSLVFDSKGNGTLTRI